MKDTVWFLFCCGEVLAIVCLLFAIVSTFMNVINSGGCRNNGDDTKT